MKRLFIVAAFVGASLFPSAFAADHNTSPAAIASFNDWYAGATEIKWHQVGSLQKADFVWNGQYRSAFYDAAGELVAETRNVAVTEMPKSLRASLKDAQGNRWITSVFVMSVDGEDTYYAAMEDAGTSVVLQSSGSKKWTVYKKTDK